MKKALFIATTGGFLSHFEEDNADLLRKMGYEIIYAANYSYHTYGVTEFHGEDETKRIYQIPVVKEPWKLHENIKAARWIWKFVQQEEVDLIVCHNPMGGVIGRLAGLFHGKKRPHVIYTAHGFHFYHGAPAKQWLIYGTAERILAQMTDQLLTINKEDYETAKHFRLRRYGKVIQIHGVGLDRSRFCPRPEIVRQVRRELRIPKDAVHFVAVSELCRNKNLKMVIYAFANILSTQGNGAVFTICGSGPEKDSLKELVRECGIQDRVRFLGYREDVEYILQSADWFVASSIREGLGMAALEALACGVPLIALNNRGTREYACDEYNSIVLYHNTEEDWQEAFRRALEEPDLRERLARNARKTTEKFSLKKTEEQMQRIFAYADQCICIQKNI